MSPTINILCFLMPSFVLLIIAFLANSFLQGYSPFKVFTKPYKKHKKKKMYEAKFENLLQPTMPHNLTITIKQIDVKEQSFQENVKIKKVLNYAAQHMTENYKLYGRISSDFFTETPFLIKNISGKSLYRFFAKLHADPSCKISKSEFQVKCSGYKIDFTTSPTVMYLFPGFFNGETKLKYSNAVKEYIESDGLEHGTNFNTSYLICYPKKDIQHIFKEIMKETNEDDIVQTLKHNLTSCRTQCHHKEINDLLENIRTALENGRQIPGIDRERWYQNYHPAFQTLCERNLSQEQQQTCKNILCKVLSCMYNPSKQLEQIDTSATISAMEKLVNMNVYEPPAS